MKNHLEAHPHRESADPASSSKPGSDAADRRPYEKPLVVDHGLLVDVALGGSPGTADSGGSTIQKPPGT